MSLTTTIGPLDRRILRKRCVACTRRKIKVRSIMSIGAICLFLTYAVWGRTTMLILYQKETRVHSTSAASEDWRCVYQHFCSFKTKQVTGQSGQGPSVMLKCPNGRFNSIYEAILFFVPSYKQLRRRPLFRKYSYAVSGVAKSASGSGCCGRVGSEQDESTFGNREKIYSCTSFEGIWLSHCAS